MVLTVATTALDPSQFGAFASVAVLLLGAVTYLARDNRELRKEQRDDAKTVLPALTESTAAVAEVTRTLRDFIRLAERLADLLEALRAERR